VVAVLELEQAMKTTRRKRYEVLTWDTDKQKFTPQQGVRRGPYTLWGLKRALRKLQSYGYPCNYRGRNGWPEGDPFVLVSEL
jgi:hypothetical protein